MQTTAPPGSDQATLDQAHPEPTASDREPSAPPPAEPERQPPPDTSGASDGGPESDARVQPAAEGTDPRTSPEPHGPDPSSATTTTAPPPRPQTTATSSRRKPAEKSNKPSTRSQGVVTDEGASWAREAVETSTLSARRRRRGQEWVSTPVRYALPVKDLLTERLVFDQRATRDYRLASNHYISAALRQIPTDVETALQWAERYQDLIGLRSPDTLGTKMPLEAEVSTAMQTLQGELRLHAGYGLLGQVQTWAIIRLLAALDAHYLRKHPDEAMETLLRRLDLAIV